MAIVVTVLCLCAGVAASAPVLGGRGTWYGGRAFAGKPMANGCAYRDNALTAASLTLPLGSWARVRNKRNRRVIEVEITDRGPYIAGRTIDLSRAAAQRLDMIEDGVVPVEVEPIPHPKRGRICRTH